MTNTPADLSAFRTAGRAKTGLTANAFGIPGDGRHQLTGGYHEGADVLELIGRFHAPATSHVGSSTEDYSARLLRDRLGLTDDASAVDIGDAWSTAAGGRAAWLRYNNLIYREMVDHPERLPALRAVNISLDGKTKRRYDQQHRGDGLIASTDSVTTHTHHEYYRDTEGTPVRAATLARQLQLIDQAITGVAAPAAPVAATPEEENDMPWLARLSDRPEVFLVAGPFSKHVRDEEELRDRGTLHNDGTERLGYKGEVRVIGNRHLLGAIIGPVPAGYEDLAAVVTPAA